ncbi:hypothetical protein [Pseudomonas putida]|uniref:Uncharacterized protein n=1 Tax=Pseudomonas putida TaxID=303 RepID=A0A8I1JIW2_PSEPU|nr:hypothetical protein [Pseudomonas putida]MBI6882969.1 hypothetical protein [Pseudomonas putida]
MRKKLNDSDLISTINAASSPLTADEIAKSLGTHRTAVVPMLRSLVSTKKIVQVTNSGSTPAFGRRPSADGAQEPLANNVIQMTQPRHKEENVESPQPQATPAAERVRKPRAVGSTKSGAPLQEGKSAQASKAPASPVEPEINQEPVKQPVAATHTLEVPVEKSISIPPVIAGASSEDARSQVLRMLSDEPATQEEIFAALGKVENVLDDLVKNEDVVSYFIIDKHVFELTPKGYDTFSALPELKVEPITVTATTPVVEDAGVAAASVADVTEEASIAAMVQPEAPQAPVEAPAATTVSTPVASSADKGDAKAEIKPVVAEAQRSEQPQQKGSESIPENPIMKEMAALMEKLVSERIQGLSEQIEQGKRDRKALTQVGTSIKKATTALQAALDALNEVAEMISE